VIHTLLFLVLQTPGDSLTISQALAHARTGRPQLAVAAARVAEARAALSTAGAVPNPTVSYTHTEDTPRNHLLVDQSFDWVLKRGADREAAQAGITRAQADSSSTTAGLLRRPGSVSIARGRPGVEGADRRARLAGRLGGADRGTRLGPAISLLERSRPGRRRPPARADLVLGPGGLDSPSPDLARVLGWDGVPPRAVGPLTNALDQLPDTSPRPAHGPGRAERARGLQSAAAPQKRRQGAGADALLQAGADWGDPPRGRASSVVGGRCPSRSGITAAARWAQARARAEQVWPQRWPRRHGSRPSAPCARRESGSEEAAVAPGSRATRCRPAPRRSGRGRARVRGRRNRHPSSDRCASERAELSLAARRTSRLSRRRRMAGPHRGWRVTRSWSRPPGRAACGGSGG
jgi:hypothetical protein